MTVLSGHPPYIVTQHYWIVAASITQVFSARDAGYVSVDNTTYQTWLAGGHRPTRIASEAELWDVLIAQAPQVVPALVLARARAQAKTYLAGGLQADRAELRAAFRLLFDENNALRAWVAGVKTAGASAATYAAFRTALAALPAMPQRTLLQVQTSMDALIDAGTVD